MTARSKVIPIFAIAMFLVAAGGAARADVELQRKLDSLFVIASSGEVRHQRLTGPAMDSIAALGADVVPLLIDKFTTLSARERWTIIWILQRIGSKAVPHLVKALNREDGGVVERVCWALGDIKDTAAAEPLMSVCGHQRWQVRDQAVEALGKIGDGRASATVMAALGDTIGQVRKSAVVACGQLAVQESVPALVHALGDDFYGARLTAINALLALDTLSVIAALADSLTSSGGTQADLACRVLGELHTDEAYELLLGQLSSPDPNRRAAAAEAIIMSDPLDNCGFRRLFIDHESDPLARLRIQSAVNAASNATP